MQTELTTTTPAGAMSLREGETYLTELMDTEGAVPEELEAEFKAVVQSAVAREIAKRESVGQFILACELKADFCRREARRITERARVFENAADRVRAYVADVIVNLPMVTKGKKTSYQKLEGSTLTMSVRNNPAKLVVDEGQVPLDYKRVNVEMPASLWNAIAEQLCLEETGISPNFTKTYSVDKGLLKGALAAGMAEAETRKEVFEGIPGASLQTGDVSLILK